MEFRVNIIKFILITIFIFLLPILSYADIAVGGYEDEQSKTHSLLLVSHNNINQWSAVNDVHGVPDTLKPLYSSAVHCAGNNCIIGGSGNGFDTAIPYLVTSNDNGYSWFYPHSISGLSPSAFEFDMTATHCSGNHCMAAGSYHEFATCNIPLFLASQDSGQTWSTANMKNMPWIKRDCVVPKFIQCENDFCIAGGTYVRDFGKSSMTSLFITNDQGKSWTFIDNKKITNLPSDLKNSYLYNGNCHTNACTVVGSNSTHDNHVNKYPLILTSQNSGKTWTYVANPKDLPVNKEVIYNLIDCVGNVCIASGVSTDTDTYTSTPFLTRSQDRLNWTVVNLKNITSFPYQSDYDFLDFTAINCSEKSCIVAGSHRKDPYTSELFFLITEDFGKTWQYSNAISGIPSSNNIVYGTIYSIKCTNGECVAAGSYNINDKSSPLPLLLTSIDHGLTWQYIANINNLPKIKKGAIYNYSLN